MTPPRTEPLYPEPLYLVTAEHYERLIDNVINGAQPAMQGSFELSQYLDHYSTIVPVRVKAARVLQRQRERNYQQWQETHSQA